MGTHIDSLPYLDISEANFSIRSSEVLAAREAHWCARTNYGLAILRYDEVHKLMRDARLRQGSYAWPALNGVSGHFAGWWSRMLLSQEGSNHARLRRLANPAFSPKLVIGLRPKFAALAHELIDAFIERGECEFMAEFAEPYATRVICTLLGLPHEKWRDLATIATEMGLALGVTFKRDVEIVDAATQKLFAYVMDLVREIRARPPTDDFLSMLVQTNMNSDEALSEEELYDMIVLAIFGGIDTTRNQIGLALEVFSRNPDQWALLGNDPELGRAAVEEVMRVRPTITWVTREAVEDFEYQDVHIRKGTTIHLFSQAAASDPRAFPDPSFDITKEQKPHFGFGGGAHHCLGHFIARGDMTEALAILANRVKNVEVVEGAKYLPDSGNTGPIVLPIRFDAGPLAKGKGLGIETEIKAAEPSDLPLSSDEAGSVPLAILFGTQTGNAEQMASDIADIARTRRFKPVVAPLNDVALDVLADIRRVLIVTSTYGNGEMPDSAQEFWSVLNGSDSTQLNDVRYSVMAMGDSGYERFCNAGRLIDQRLHSRGAQRIAARVDCDVNYATKAFAWVDGALMAMAEVSGEDRIDIKEALQAGTQTRQKWSKRAPYPAKVVLNVPMSGSGSEKETRHIALDIKGSGLNYEAGDCIGLIPSNEPELVTALQAHFGICSHARAKGFDEPLGILLSEKFDIRNPSQELVAELARHAVDEELGHVVSNGDRASLDAWLWNRDVLDLVRMLPNGSISLEKFLSLLTPLQHRTYSISSSPKAHADEIHLTVATVKHSAHGRERLGVGSGFIARRMPQGSEARIFLSPNRAFRLPADPSVDVIMVGPGTGVAPFRAFLQDRQVSGGTGRNWLFFGEQRQDADFLYRDELVALKEANILTRLDTAFSRDQAEKIYVQHRMRENAEELFRWLEGGASFYVCGDAKAMAQDVEDALLDILTSLLGGRSDAERYLDDLRSSRRYLRDVY
ncbi:MAG TPA: cytochrome P450 [Ensifer sp.]|nr:cytochrome P450 [Ensifer sp.]